MPLNQNDLRDVLTDRADIPTVRASRLDEVRRKIRRRNVAKAATGIAASAVAAAVVAIGAPAIAGRFGGTDSNGLTIAGSPSATHTPSVKPGPSGTVHFPGSVKFTVPASDPTAMNTFPRSQFHLTKEGDAYRVTIAVMGDLANLRGSLRDVGVNAVLVPSPGFGDCVDADADAAFSGARVPSPGVWDFVVRPDKFGPDRELAVWNNANSRGMLLVRTYCRSLR